MATEKVQMRDLVVLLPGITGSVLQKGGKDLWALTVGAALRTIRTLGLDLETMALRDDDPEDGEPQDGITATSLMPDVHIVPGLIKVDGYGGVRELFRSRFQMIAGSVTEKYPANYFEFPYDWRRDNRVAARSLARFVEERLRLWREKTSADAQVIILAHSMGGLVARYYLEALGGWQSCKALITFGTPFAGSVNALNFLVNGHKTFFIDMTEAMRTFPSVYQLLPTYKVVSSGGELRRVSDAVPAGLDERLVERAVAFHREIEGAVESNRRNPDYLRGGYITFPMVGVDQPTLQSATYAGGRLSADRRPLPGLSPLLAEGDGTVPQLSAVPFDLLAEQRDTFYAERHGSLQNNRGVLGYVYERLKRMQISGWQAAIRGGDGPAERPSSISLDVEDVYAAGRPVVLKARVLDPDKRVVDPSTVRGRWGGLTAAVAPHDGAGPASAASFAEGADGWETASLHLPPGVYRVAVGTVLEPEASPAAVHDVFEVIGGE